MHATSRNKRRKNTAYYTSGSRSKLAEGGNYPFYTDGRSGHRFKSALDADCRWYNSWWGFLYRCTPEGGDEREVHFGRRGILLGELFPRSELECARIVSCAQPISPGTHVKDYYGYNGKIDFSIRVKPLCGAIILMSYFRRSLSSSGHYFAAGNSCTRDILQLNFFLLREIFYFIRAL